MDALNGATFLSGANAEFIAELYSRYLEDPSAVDDSWRAFFAEFGDDAASVRAERAGPPWARPLPPLAGPVRTLAGTLSATRASTNAISTARSPRRPSRL